MALKIAILSGVISNSGVPVLEDAEDEVVPFLPICLSFPVELFPPGGVFLFEEEALALDDPLRMIHKKLLESW